MNLTVSGFAVRSLTLASALMLSTAAFAAPDAQKIADAFVAAAQTRDEAKVTFDAAKADGDNVTLSNVVIKAKHGGDVTIPLLVIESPIERTAGGFTAASIGFDSGKIVDKETTINWTKGLAKDAIVPAPTEINSKAKITPFSNLEISTISVVSTEAPAPITVDSFNVALGNVIEGAPNDGQLHVNGVNVPGDVLKSDEQTKDWVEQLGYDKLNFDVAVDGSYDGSNKTFTFKSISFDGKDVGKLAITGTFGGLPREKLQDPDKLSELAATATVDAATIRFDNAGIVQRVIDMQAKAMGATPDQFVDQISGALPLLLSVVGNQNFQDRIATAATAFLKDPKSLTITAAPGNPVPVMQIFGAASTAPQTLPDVLAVDIKANN
ncbi:hypothetical protein K32_16580 [Kaistia sp. 32K]|uniref:hypothetical protein n=1 Tax=Kaistia sp. 32K TaxID=2795690 RepID=UPI001915BC89|nr:hypothetical protein [Kaistia sp. 32K]BCP53041.1 hypothetical protein K32_16580 [Kaistia sp. 32K]